MRLDTAETHRDLDCSTPVRWALLVALLVIGIGYVLAFLFFLSNSRNFIEEARNREALEYSRAHPLTPPATVVFGAGAEGNHRLGAGWHPPDTGGVWSSTRNSWLELAIQHPGVDSVLALNVTAPIVPTRERMKIKLYVNGELRGSWIRTSDNATAPFEVQLPQTVARQDRLDLKLRVDHLVSPMRLGVGPDSRNLGVLLHSIELR